jgi:hypothetical protein
MTLIGNVTDSNHPAGFANPNQFFVFAIDKEDLPDYVPQQIFSVSGHFGRAGECSFVKDDRDEHGHFWTSSFRVPVLQQSHVRSAQVTGLPSKFRFVASINFFESFA